MEKARAAYRLAKGLVKRVLQKPASRWRPIQLSHVGSAYGGAYVALELLNANSIVYSVGVGEDVSFDEQLIARTGCRIFGIDPTPRSKDYVGNRQLPAQYSFVGVGLADKSGIQRFYYPRDASHVSMSLVDDSGEGAISAEFLTLQDLLARLGHTYVHLLKIDIEGAEYALLEFWLNAGYAPPAGQIWIEFHPQRAHRSAAHGIELARRFCKLGFLPIADGDRGVLLLNLSGNSPMPTIRWNGLQLGLERAAA